MYSFAANNSLTNGSYAYTLYAVNAAGERITNDFTGTFTYAKVGSVNCTVSYKTQIQKTGWESSYVTNGTTSGTVGKSLRLEAIQINLAGDIGDYFDIYYRVQAEKFGWLGWAKNGEAAGTSNYALRLEAIQIVVKAKNAYCISDKPTSMGGVFDASDKYAYYNKNTLPRLIYSTHVQSYGWMSWVSNGAVAGTIGKSKRLEAISIKLVGGGDEDRVTYKTYVQNNGWGHWRYDGNISGTFGQGKGIEALMVRLTGTGTLKSYYDIYYRARTKRFGWSAWAKNAEKVGSLGYDETIEAVQIIAIPKSAPISAYHIATAGTAYREK